VTTLRVLSYNVRGLRDDGAALARVVAGSGAHVVFVQEAPKVVRWRSRCAALARGCGMVVVTGGGTAAGNLLMASVGVRVHAARSLFLPLTPGQQLRGAAVAHCSIGGSEFTAVGTHLSLNPAERVRQVPLLLAEVPEDGPPLILAADFNEQPGGPVWEALAPRLDDAAAVAGDTGTPTFSCASPRRRIDGFFVDRRVVVSGYQVLDSADVRRASDHFPVYAELKLPT
jgi:endonuclease/exonuclease/phosphatase family metal-dependent hydrolase